MTQIKGDIRGLKDQIIAQAKARCQEIITQSKEEATQVLRESRARGKAELEQIIADTKEKAAEKQRQMLIAAELERRKEVLTEKREAMDQAFAEAVAAFAKLPAAEYQVFFRELLLSSHEPRCRELVIAPEESRITPEFVAQVAKELDWELELVREEQEKLAMGGFLLRGERLEIDSSLPTILGLLRPELEGEVAQILFGEL